MPREMVGKLPEIPTFAVAPRLLDLASASLPHGEHAMKMLSCAFAALLVMALSPAPASAQPGWRQSPAYAQGPAYDNGYRAGFDIGARDARDGRPFDVRRHDVYRDGDRGYDRRYGNRGQYKQVFRAGFDRGYSDGYARYGRGGRAIPRDRGYGYPGSSRYPDDGRYPDRYPSYPGRRGGGYGYYSPAYDRGFSEGYDKGRDDGRDGRQFEVERHKWYRQGDHGYKGEHGSRDRYKAEYRDAFRQGYERGYREVRDEYRSDRRWPF
jgi:hypothetical protein